MKLYKISTLVGQTIITKSENEAFVKETEDGFNIKMLHPKEPISIDFPEFYSFGKLKGQEIEIECEII